ncbi:MAG: PQQ-binding-like beta-propeller repeat protein [Planctomycetota bacterium]|nr:PQQ-binding-like beta-propeller repeat protein [Planctomycetota bacterium]
MRVNTFLQLACFMTVATFLNPIDAEQVQGRRDIALEPVLRKEIPIVSEYLNGYTTEELRAAEKAVPRREDPELPKPIPRQVTVHGKAFLEKNENGKPEDDESGLGGLIISDGETITRTGKDGTFRLSIKMEDETHHRFVFAVRPSGRRPTTPWFLRIPFAEQRTDYLANFGFAEETASDKSDFWFIVGSDSQFTSISQMLPIAKDYGQITGAPGSPAFMITVGDLTMNGTQFEWDMYDRIRGASKIRVYDGFGGHDGNHLRSTANFEERIGPPWYSWEYGGVHFFHMMTEGHYLTPRAKARQQAWIDADLKSIPKGMPVIVTNHYPLPPSWFDQRKAEGVNILCQLAAHWHLVQRGSRDGVPVLNSAPARGRDWGAYSRAYRWVRVRPEGIETEIRIAGHYQRLEVLSPGPKSVIGRRPLVALAYDSSHTVRSLTCRITGPHGRSVSPKLVQRGDWSWHGELDTDAVGQWNFALEAVDSGGRVWKRSQKIEVLPKELADAAPTGDLPWFMAGNPPRRAETGPKPPLYPLWVNSTGGVHVLHSSPVVSGGRIFLGTTDPNVGKSGSSVLCLDAATGKEMWRAPSPRGDLRGPLAVHDGSVFAVTGESWAAAWDARTGKPLWSQPLREDYRRGRPLAVNQSPPIPLTDGLLVSDWQSPQFLLDYGTGKKLATLKGNIGYYDSFPCEFDGVMYCARRGGSEAIRIPSGEVVWKADEKSRSTSAGIVADGRFIYTCSAGVRALDIADGKELWKGKWGQTGYKCPVPVVWDDLVLANGARLFGLDLKTGATRFDVSPNTDAVRFERAQRQAFGGASTPFIAGDYAYFGHDDATVKAISRTGKVIWEYYVGVPVKTSPVVSGNLVFVHDYAGNLWCFAPAE